MPYAIRIEFDQRLVMVGNDAVHKGERSVIEDDPAVIVSNQDHQVYFARTVHPAKHNQTPIAGSYPKFAERQIFHNGVALAVSWLAERRQWWKPRHDPACRLDCAIYAAIEMADHLAPAILARLIDYCDQASRRGRTAVRIYPTVVHFNFVFRKFRLEVAPKGNQSGRLRRCRS